jgi:transposase
MAYAMEFRRAVAKAYDECGSSIDVAEQFECSESWVRRLIQRRHAAGSLDPRPARRPDNRKLDDGDLGRLRELIRATPDLTLAELAAALGNKASVPTVWRAAERLGLPLKQKSTHAAEQDRPDVKAARDAWFDGLAGVPVADLVFLDEFGAATNMARTRARGPRGERVVCKVPHGHWKVLSTVAAMTAGGMLTAAACTFDAAVDTDLFVAFVEQFLAPALRPGQVVVLDNLKAHCSPRVDAAVEKAGCRVLRLPPYSPDFNPIEMAISKVKSVLRRLGRRTVDALYPAIGEALASVTADDAAGFTRHCGYSATAA